MQNKIVKVADDFWNIRGSFKIKGLLDIGTHASLIRKKSGKFLILDSLSLDEQTLKSVYDLTRQGEDVEEVLNLHPFHTIHVKKMHEQFPQAKHYGTRRHIEKEPQLSWQELKVEDLKLQDSLREDLLFSIPRGVDFISTNENLHFSSVLAYHHHSRTIHVDDTFTYILLPKALNRVGVQNPLSFHLTLAKVLEHQSGAVEEFERWAKDLAENWKEAKNLCAAHSGNLLDQAPGSLKHKILQALEKVRPKLIKHQEKFSS